MAKDPAMGPISKPEGGHYGDPEEVPEEEQVTAEDVVEEAEAEEIGAEKGEDTTIFPRHEEVEIEEILTRSPIINLFGEKVGQLLLDAGYSSMAAVIMADDEVLLGIKGIGEAALKEIRSIVPEQEEAPASVRVRRIREASQS